MGTIRALLFFLAMVGASSVQAQAYMNFQCADGPKLSLIFEKAGTAGASRRFSRCRRKGPVQYDRPLADNLRRSWREMNDTKLVCEDLSPRI
jgi:hypothetical protein